MLELQQEMGISKSFLLPEGLLPTISVLRLLLLELCRVWGDRNTLTAILGQGNCVL